MNALYNKIFTKQSLANIERTGNVWGITQEYDFNFSIRLLWRIWQFERKSATAFMGRHGGGWNVKIGVQAGSWKSLLTFSDIVFALGGTMLRVRK
jgi:hypothetical protein